MPEPRPNEDEDEFIERCMADDTMQRDFEDEEQRLAVCERQWGGEKATMNKKWYTIKAQTDTDGPAEISIFNEIGMWGTDASQFQKDLAAIDRDKRIMLYVNSPGGNVFDGMAIYNMLASRRDKVDVEIMGLAASAASVVALAGSTLTMAEGTYFMIHNPYTMAVGDADEMEKTAGLLRKTAGEFANIYAANSNLSTEEALELMKKETWLTATEAEEYGFVDTVDNTIKDAAANAARYVSVFEKYGFARVPERLHHKAQINEDTQAEVIGLLESKSDAVDIMRDVIGRDDFNEDAAAELVGLVQADSERNGTIVDLLGATDESARASAGRAPKRRMQTKRGAERALRDAGFTASLAKQILAGGYPRDEEPKQKQQSQPDTRSRAQRLLASNYEKVRR
jgi:ATP-dependent Clp endopeptidase proteolytic subunit ClpP